MLPQPTVPASLAILLTTVRPCFTAPSYRTFCQLACGLVAAGGRRTVTGMLTGAGLARLWHHSRAHHLFAYARWSPDRLGLALALLRDDAFDALLTGESRFDDLPGVMARLADGRLPALCHTIAYDEE